MPGEEKVEKVSNAVSGAQHGIPADKTSEIPAKVSESFACEICGKPFDTKRKLTGHMSVHSKKSETTEEDLPDEFLDERETLDRIIAEATPTRKRKAIVRMVSRHLGNKRESIETLAEALRLADVQPHLRNLIVKNWASHMDIPDIEDVLDIEKKEETKKEGEKKEGEKKTEEKKTPTVNMEEILKKGKDRRLSRLESLSIQKEIADMEKEVGVGKEEEEKEKHTLIVDGVPLKVTAEEMLSWKRYLLEQKKAEEEREERKEERKERLDAERHPQNDGGLVEWVVGEGSNTRTILVRPETIPLLIQAQGSKNQPQNPSPSREDIAQMVERTIEAQTKKLTTDDVERIIQRTMSSYSPGALTKNDLLYLEAKDKLRLEEKKLDEGGKTRDVIGNAIRGGFDHAGKIISRMMTEEGGGATGMSMEGYMDQGGNMMQIACPGCNAAITAPVGSPMVLCPGCGKRWTVERPEQIPPKTEEKKPPEFIPNEKKVIEKSLEDAKEGRIKPLETSETSDAPKIISEPTSDASEVKVTYVPRELTTDVEKIAQNIAIGEAADYLEGEVKKKKELKKEETTEVKKSCPKIDSNICPICNKKCKSKLGVGLHVDEMHPEYER